MREEAEVQAGNHNYLLPPSLQLCLQHQLWVILGEKTLNMTGMLLPWLPCREARQADLRVQICSQHLFSSGNVGNVIRNNDQPSCQSKEVQRASIFQAT